MNWMVSTRVPSRSKRTAMGRWLMWAREEYPTSTPGGRARPAAGLRLAELLGGAGEARWNREAVGGDAGPLQLGEPLLALHLSVRAEAPADGGHSRRARQLLGEDPIAPGPRLFGQRAPELLQLLERREIGAGDHSVGPRDEAGLGHRFAVPHLAVVLAGVAQHRVAPGDRLVLDLDALRRLGPRRGPAPPLRQELLEVLALLRGHLGLGLVHGLGDPSLHTGHVGGGHLLVRLLLA